MPEAALAGLRRELAQPLPHPDLELLRQWSDQLTDWLLRDFETLAEQPVGVTASRSEMERLLREPPPEERGDFTAVLAEFQAKVLPYTFRPNHPRFLAFIPGAPSYVSVLADILASGTNLFCGVWLEAAGPAQIELVVLDWFRTWLGLPESARGVLTSGGSEANLTALAVARDRLNFADRPRAALYVSELRHLSVDRAARILGLRPEQIRPVPADDQFRLQPSAVANCVQRDRAAGLLPWAVAANAGATNTGTVDPLAELAAFCRQENVWLHVDAAYGWPAALTAAGRRELHGIGEADSVTLDPHKWFAQTFEAGCVLIHDGRRLTETFAVQPDYMQDVLPGEDEVNFSDHGLALSRRFRALKIWCSVKVLGLRWHRELVERCCRLAEYAQALLEQSGDFEILCPRQLSIVCFRYRPARVSGEAELDRINLGLVEALRATRRVFISSTRLKGRVALRFCFINWRTTAGDVEEAITLLSNLAQKRI